MTLLAGPSWNLCSRGPECQLTLIKFEVESIAWEASGMSSNGRQHKATYCNCQGWLPVIA